LECCYGKVFTCTLSACAIFTIPCGLHYYSMKTNFGICGVVIIPLIYLLGSIFCMLPFLVGLFVEIFHILGWLLSCFCCFKRKHCKCRSVKPNDLNNNIECRPPYDHQEIIKNQSNLGIPINFFIFLFLFFGLQNNPNILIMLKKTSVVL
jgi:hypothetical protein